MGKELFLLTLTNVYLHQGKNFQHELYLPQSLVIKFMYNDIQRANGQRKVKGFENIVFNHFVGIFKKTRRSI